MVPLTDLLIPILVAAVIVFIASSIIHMVLQYHKSDYQKLPHEDEVLTALRDQDVGPGEYSFPRPASMKDMGSPEMIEKYNQGPVGMMTVLPNGPPAMGKHLALWFAFCLLIGVFVAYLTGRTLDAGAHYMAVFRIAGTVAFLGYGIGDIINSVWKGQSWSTTCKNVCDGLVYALLTAGVFGWLWPR